MAELMSAMSLSMRALAQEDRAQFDATLSEYCVKLERAFPLEGELETLETYEDYLLNPKSTWEMLVLREAGGEIVGGIQYQIVTVNGVRLKKIAWVEHIWVEEESRTFPNFRGLLRVAQESIVQAGAASVFMEFNNPSKMTPEQIEDDARGGITTQDRQTIWGFVGINVAVDSHRNIAAYGQPSMDGQPSVEYLSLGFIGLEPLAGQTILVPDYLALCYAAHLTIPGVDLDQDETVLGYTKELLAVGEKELTFVRLDEMVDV